MATATPQSQKRNSDSTKPSDASTISPARSRAHDPDEKTARREAILDAAARLFYRSQQLPNVAEVAVEAGLAKGTLYLYFPTREAIYLALHQRHAAQFFTALIETLDQPTPFAYDQMFAIVDRYMINNPNFLPLCNFCLSVSSGLVDTTTHNQFQTAMAQWLYMAGDKLEKKLPNLHPGDGLRLLHHGYALILGMYQLLGQPSALEQGAICANIRGHFPGLGNFHDETKSALSAYWERAIASGLPAIEIDSTPQKKTQ